MASCRYICGDGIFPASVAQRIRIVLLLDERLSYVEIGEQLRVPASTIARWKRRFQQDGLLGLATIHPGQPPSKLTPALRARVLERTRQAPPDGSKHWSLRKMAAVMKISKNLVARIWHEAELKPHRLERYMASNDPDLRRKPLPSSAFTWSLHKTRRFSVWTKRAPFRRWIDSTAACRYLQDGPKSMVSSITAMEPCRFMRHSIRKPAE